MKCLITVLFLFIWIIAEAHGERVVIKKNSEDVNNRQEREQGKYE